MQTPLVLVDGSSYFFRAYHALPPLTNSKGQPLGAVYGVVNMVKRLLKDYQPERLAMVFDAKGKTFRDDMYSEYKANRPPMPDDLRAQFEPMIKVLDAMGLPILIIEGVEADDVIGTLAEAATHQAIKTIISTGDKDLAQLVNDQVTLVNTMTNVVLDPDGVVNKFGVKPDRIIDYLALIGDKSDNVPGVDKVGPKTAVKWLTQYEDLDTIVDKSGEIGGKVGENLRNSLDQLALSRRLVTIKKDVELPVTLAQLTPELPDEQALEALYHEYEFNTWLRQLKQSQGQVEEPEAPPEVKKDYQLVDSQDAFDALVEKLSSSKQWVFDTETTSLDVLSAELVGISFCMVKHHAYYLPLGHAAGQQLDREACLDALKPLFENEKIAKIGQNLKYDINVLRRYDIDVCGPLFDTMLESYVLNSAQNRHDMDSMALKFLGHETIKFEEVAGKGKQQVTFDQVSIEKALPYAAEDADITFQLHRYLWPRLKSIPNLRKVFEEIEMPLVKVLAEMEDRGVLIDSAVLKKQSDSLTTVLSELQDKAYQLAGKIFNLNSPKQLQQILFEELNLPILKKTPKGQPSTAEEVLQTLAYDYELPKIILSFRSLFKLLTTYVDALPERINPLTQRVHTSYNQAVTSTGRLSSSDPNLQNIPIRTPEGRAVRHAFIAKPEHQLVAFDYSQIELRIMAHLSQDAGLLEAFSEGLDIHQATASEIFEVPLAMVTHDQRRSSKAVNFGLIYGMSAFGLAKQLGIDRGQAQAYIDMYFERYPGVKQYMHDTRTLAHEQGYVETIFGRRLYLPDIQSKNKMLVKAAERAAINAPMQGSAADIIKRAMIDIDGWISETCEELNIQMIMQVHDELVFEIKSSEMTSCMPQLKHLMEHAVQLDVPLDVACGQGHNWEEAH